MKQARVAPTVRVLAISGSLRAASLNTALLQAAVATRDDLAEIPDAAVALLK